jgi:hypothetical protein
VSDPRYIEVEGDKPLVEDTRHYFAALRAGLKTAEECSFEAENEIGNLRAERDRLRKQVERLEAELEIRRNDK